MKGLIGVFGFIVPIILIYYLRNNENEYPVYVQIAMIFGYLAFFTFLIVQCS